MTRNDPYLSPKVQQHHLSPKRYYYKPLVNDLSSVKASSTIDQPNYNPSSQVRNPNHFGATNRGYRGIIIKASPVTQRKMLQ
jgi:hypothetical protein